MLCNGYFSGKHGKKEKRIMKLWSASLRFLKYELLQVSSTIHRTLISLSIKKANNYITEVSKEE